MGLPITPFNPPQIDVLGTYARLAQIKNAQQENRLQQQQAAENDLKIQQEKMKAQQQQKAQREASIFDAAQNEAGGDPYKTRDFAIKKGASQESIAAFDAQQAKIKDTLSQMAERDSQTGSRNLDILDRQHQNLRDQFSAILSLPPEQQQPAYDAKVAELRADPETAKNAYGIPDPSKLPPYPGPQVLLSQANALAGQHRLIGEQKDAAETAKAKAEASMAEAKSKLASNPQDLNATIDGIADPKKYPDLNKRMKFQMGFAQRNAPNDPDGPAKVIASGMQEVGSVEKALNPDIINAEKNKAIAVQKAASQTGGALADVPPHLVTPATAAADKAGQAYADAVQAGDDMKTFVDLARSGNKIAYSYSPVEGVLTLNTGRGVKRVNFAEIASYAGAGSAADRLKGWFGKQTSGASIPPNILNDIEQLHQAVSNNALKGYKNKLSVVNSTYGSKFEPVQLGGDQSPQAAQGKRPSLADIFK